MAAINDLIAQIENAELRERIAREVERMSKQKKFGLVFEEHLPECTPLYDIPVKAGSHVALKTGNMNDTFSVMAVSGEKALCFHEADDTQCELPIADLVCVAQFGEAIYPYLKPLDSVCNAPDSDLWHTLIEADNYHALQLLEYLYGGKVDCIYIDPPYNTRANDWKYNNDYVDPSDVYRHSKWLSMMKKRLELAKKLLNPRTGVMIITIDEHEVHHLRTLLEDIFSDFYIQMTTDVINPKGVTQGRFSRVEEYNIFCFAPNAYIDESDDNLLNPPEEKKALRWKGLLRSGTDALRSDRENMFYPVLIDSKLSKVVDVGDPLPIDIVPDPDALIDNYSVAWPIREDGSWGRWSVGADTLRELISKGYVSCGKFDAKRHTWGITYISQPNQQAIEDGKIIITGHDAITGVVNVEYTTSENRVVKTVWHRTSHDAGAYGSDMLTAMIGKTNAFSFPKSLYSERDSIASVVRNKKDAIILDFFAGSGTTLHAVNLLNAEDGGHRRCILVTNNEVNDPDDRKRLTSMGYQPGDDEWEKSGIARAVTWPRTVCAIMGCDINGKPLRGEYGIEMDAFEIDDEISAISKITGKPIKKAVYKKHKKPVYPRLVGVQKSDGFRANAAFFKLGFLDKTEVKLGRQFKELLPVIWLKAGAVGKCPALESNTLPDMLILPENKFAVLLDENTFSEFEEKMKDYPEIQTVFLVTDYEPAYVSMSKRLNVQITYQLYRDYLDNFRINIRREQA